MTRLTTQCQLPKIKSVVRIFLSSSTEAWVEGMSRPYQTRTCYVTTTKNKEIAGLLPVRPCAGQDVKSID